MGRPWWLLIALAAAVTTWVGGFDILYSLPDELRPCALAAFDTRRGG
jgi:hypothetical protein